jgi:hypothetical protein
LVAVRRKRQVGHDDELVRAMLQWPEGVLKQLWDIAIRAGIRFANRECHDRVDRGELDPIGLPAIPLAVRRWRRDAVESVASSFGPRN